MKELTTQQKDRCVYLLDVIVKPGDHDDLLCQAIEEAQEIFGYSRITEPKPPRKQRQKRPGYYDIRKPA